MDRIQELTLKLDLASYYLANIGTEKMKFECFMDGKNYPIDITIYQVYLLKIAVSVERIIRASMFKLSFTESLKLLSDQYLKELNHEEEIKKATRK